MLDRPRPRRSPALLLLVAGALLLAGLTACGGTTAPTPTPSRPLKVAWLNQGKVGTDVWTDAHHRAAEAVAERFGRKVRTTFTEEVAPGADAAATIDRLVRNGTTLVFATSYPFQADVLAAARKYPKVKFDQARGTERRANVGTYGGADEEPLYLAGMAAGADAPDGRIGFVGTVQEPETVRHVDAFTLGARRTNPTARVTVAWTGSWYDPAKEEALARQLVDQGAQVLVSGSVTDVLGDVARTTGTGWVGHDADRSTTYADVWLAAAVPDWTSYYTEQVGDVLAGTWRPTAYYGSMRDGFTDLSPLGARVGPATRDAVEAARAQLRAGTLDVFAGPVTDDRGTERVPAGATLPPDQRQQLDWFVDGVAVAGRVPTG
jgi:basic membrane protein A